MYQFYLLSYFTQYMLSKIALDIFEPNPLDIFEPNPKDWGQSMSAMNTRLNLLCALTFD